MAKLRTLTNVPRGCRRVHKLACRSKRGRTAGLEEPKRNLRADTVKRNGTQLHVNSQLMLLRPNLARHPTLDGPTQCAQAHSCMPPQPMPATRSAAATRSPDVPMKSKSGSRLPEVGSYSSFGAPQVDVALSTGLVQSAVMSTPPVFGMRCIQGHRQP